MVVLNNSFIIQLLFYFVKRLVCDVQDCPLSRLFSDLAKLAQGQTNSNNLHGNRSYGWLPAQLGGMGNPGAAGCFPGGDSSLFDDHILRSQALVLGIVGRACQDLRLAAVAEDLNVEGGSRRGVFRRDKDKGQAFLHPVTI